MRWTTQRHCHHEPYLSDGAASLLFDLKVKGAGKADLEEAIGESKGVAGAPAVQPATSSALASTDSIRALVSHLMTKMDSNSAAPSTSSSSQHPPTVEVLAEKPQRAVIAPRDHVKGAAVHVTRLAHKKK